MKKYVLFTLLLLVLSIATVYAAATVITTWVAGQDVKIVKISWTSNSAGDVDMDLGGVIEGEVFAVVTIPSAETGLVPTDNYDIWIKDTASDMDYFTTTTLLNRDTANTEMVLQTDVPIYRPMTFSVDAAGDVTAGDCWLYVKVPR